MSSFRNGLIAAAVVVVNFAGPALSQTASSGPVVADKNGKAVGTLLGRNEVLVKFADGEAVLAVDSFGISTSHNASPSYRYATPDCTGPRYADASSFPAYGYFDVYPTKAEPGKSLGGTIYYAKRPFRKITVMSVGAPGACMGYYEVNATVGSVGKSDYVPGYTLPLGVK